MRADVPWSMSYRLCFVEGLIEIVRGGLWHHAGTRARTVLLVSRNALGVLPILSEARAVSDKGS